LAYDERLAARVRRAIAGKGRVEEKRMFGGLTFMLDGKMCCGVLGDRLMVRVAPQKTEALLARPGAKPMNFTGRRMEGFLFVGPEGTGGAKALNAWVEEAVGFVKTVKARRRK